MGPYDHRALIDGSRLAPVEDRGGDDEYRWPANFRRRAGVVLRQSLVLCDRHRTFGVVSSPHDMRALRRASPQLDQSTRRMRPLLILGLGPAAAAAAIAAREAGIAVTMIGR